MPPDLDMLLVVVHGSTCTWMPPLMYDTVAYLNSMMIPCICLVVIDVAMVGFLVVSTKWVRSTDLSSSTLATSENISNCREEDV